MDAIALDSFDEMDRLISTYVDIPMYNYMFESADPKTAAAEASNARVAEKSTTLLQKIINGIKAIFRAIKEKLTNMFDYVMASSEEKVDFNTFLKEIQGDPEFKGKKITFHDYRKILAEMDSSCSEFEREYTKFKESEAEDNPNLVKTIQTKLEEFGIKSKEVLQAEAASFTLEVAVAYAKQSRKHSEKIQRMIQFDMGLLAAIERELGSNEVRKFKKKIAKLNNSSKIIRLLAGGRQKQADTLADALNDVTGSLRKLWRVHKKARKGAHKDEVRSSERAVLRAGMGIMQATHEGKKAPKDKKRVLRNKLGDKRAELRESRATEKAYDKKIARREKELSQK